ncbi:hypothetical protein ACHAWT_009836, partial [Skeletonema menzelii]
MKSCTALMAAATLAAVYATEPAELRASSDVDRELGWDSPSWSSSGKSGKSGSS